MDELRKSIRESEALREKLPILRQDQSKEGLVKYNETLLEATDKQHNIYNRLRLMGDPESVQTADEMEHVAEMYLGKSKNVSMDSFFKKMKREITWQLNWLTGSKRDRDEDRE